MNWNKYCLYTRRHESRRLLDVIRSEVQFASLLHSLGREDELDLGVLRYACSALEEINAA